MIVKDWMDSYHSDSGKALCQLINFFIHSCGANTHLSEEDIVEKDRDEILVEVAEDAQKQGIDKTTGSPLMYKGKDKDGKAFKSRYTEFMGKIVEALRDEGDLYDDRAMTCIIEWLTEIAALELRAFRYTATVGALEVVTELIDVALEEHRHMDSAIAGLEAEKKKKKKSKAGEAKCAQYESDISEVEEKVSALNQLMQEVFVGVFVHRYRDVDPVVRALCLKSLGQWMLQYPKYFMEDAYLKYIGWCLNDKHASCRIASLQAILEIYNQDDDEFVQKLNLFTSRFAKRFQEMNEDVDSEVAALSVKLMTALLKAGTLTETDGELIPTFIWDSDPDMRAAACDFLIEDTFAMDEEERTGADKNADDMQQLVNVLVEYAPKSRQFDGSNDDDYKEGVENLDQEVKCLVLGTWGRVDALTDWAMMRDQLLLSESSERKKRKAADVPDDNRQTILTVFLLHCATRCMKLPTGKHTRIQKEETDRARDDISTFLASNLVKMLKTFQADPWKVWALVQLPRYMDLDKFALMRKQKELDEMLSLLQKMYLKHTHPRVLHELASTLNLLCAGAHDFQANGNECVREIATQLLSRLDTLAKAKREDTESVRVTLLRMNILAKQTFVKQLQFNPSCDELLQRHLSKEDGNEEVVGLLLKLCKLTIMWSTNHAIIANNKKGKKTKKGEAELIALVDDVKAWQQALLGHIAYALTNDTTSFALKNKSWEIATDMFRQMPANKKPSFFTRCTVEVSQELLEAYTEHGVLLLTGDEREGDEDDAAIEFRRQNTSRCIAQLALVDFKRQVALVCALISCVYQNEHLLSMVKTVLNDIKDKFGAAVLMDVQLQACIQKFERGEKDLVKFAGWVVLVGHASFTKKTGKYFYPFLHGALEYAYSETPSRLSFLDGVSHFFNRCTTTDLQHAVRDWESMDDTARVLMETSQQDKDDDDDDIDDIDRQWLGLNKFEEDLKLYCKKKHLKWRARGNETMRSRTSKRTNLSGLTTPASSMGGMSDYDMESKHGGASDDDEPFAVELSAVKKPRSARKRAGVTDDDEDEDEDTQTQTQAISQSSQNSSQSSPTGTGSSRKRGRSQSRSFSSSHKKKKKPARKQATRRNRF